MIYGSGVKHVAKFWLKCSDDVPEIEKRVAELARIPQVLDLVVGGPLDSDWGRRIDKSYDLAFIASFRSLADCRAYFDCEVHQRVAGELQEIAHRVEAMYVAY
jgi:hypothetical protein